MPELEKLKRYRVIISTNITAGRYNLTSTYTGRNTEPVGSDCRLGVLQVGFNSNAIRSL